jgi:fatty-acyl-CoA synthase
VPSGHTLAEVLRRTARRTPSLTALRCGNTSWTYAELNARARQASVGLTKMRIAKGDRVAVLSRNSPEFAVVRFAIARVGAVLVPINFMLRPEEIGYILRHSGAKLLFVDGGLADTARAAVALDTAVETLV